MGRRISPLMVNCAMASIIQPAVSSVPIVGWAGPLQRVPGHEDVSSARDVERFQAACRGGLLSSGHLMLPPFRVTSQMRRM